MFDNTENEIIDPPNTLLREEAIDRGEGQRPIITSSEDEVVGDDGKGRRRTTMFEEQAADGRWLKVDQFVAESWSGEKVPNDRLFSCLNSFGHHEYRLVYLDIDGAATGLGNILCAECLETNSHRQKARKWTLGLYNPEEF